VLRSFFSHRLCSKCMLWPGLRFTQTKISLTGVMSWPRCTWWMLHETWHWAARDVWELRFPRIESMRSLRRSCVAWMIASGWFEASSLACEVRKRLLFVQHLPLLSLRHIAYACSTNLNGSLSLTEAPTGIRKTRFHAQTKFTGRGTQHEIHWCKENDMFQIVQRFRAWLFQWSSCPFLAVKAEFRAVIGLILKERSFHHPCAIFCDKIGFESCAFLGRVYSNDKRYTRLCVIFDKIGRCSKLSSLWF